MRERDINHCSTEDVSETKHCEPTLQCCKPSQPLLHEERYAEIDPMTWCDDNGNWRFGERGLFG